MSDYEDLTERQLGEFRLLRLLGRGGMAEVYLAEQTSLQRNVAVKVLREEMIPGSDSIMLQRFKQEATAAAGLTHPNIVQVYTIGEQDGYHYIAQEYVQGKNLAEFLKTKGAPDLKVALLIMRQVALALKAAGAKGVVHRDIKPENIMLTKKGEVKVADFGLAQLQERHDDVSLTQKGTTLGTPLYMSPEQVSGEPVDHRSDIYSFGVTCYHMLSGGPPYTGTTAMAIAVQHVNKQAPPLKERAAKIPDLVCRVVHRMMAKKPDHRYPSADAVLQDLKALTAAAKQGGILKDMKLPVLSKLESRERRSGATAGGGKPVSEPEFKPLGDEPELKPLDGDPVEAAAKTIARPAPETPKPAAAKTKPAAPPSSKSAASPAEPAKKTVPRPAEPAARAATESPASRSRRATETRTPPEPKPRAPRKTSAPAAKPDAPARKPETEDDDNEVPIRGVQTDFEEMDLTPMVDVTFLLLIFFMITASFSLQKTIEIPPPDSDEKGAPQTIQELEELEDESVMVDIDEENMIYIDDEPLSDVADIVDVLNDKILNEQKTELVLTAHEQCMHETVVIVLDAAQEVGMQKIRQVVMSDS